jgi:hypothetical protein
MDNQNDIPFIEIQRFRQVWLWVLLIMVSLLLFGSIIFVFVVSPKLLMFLMFVGPIFTLLGLGLPIFFYIIKMTTEIDNEGIHLYVFPLAKEYITFQSILSVEKRIYRPIAEYGGWGVRHSSKGKAFNISGDQGVQLELVNGEKVLIGSQRADEMATIIRSNLTSQDKAASV